MKLILEVLYLNLDYIHGWQPLFGFHNFHLIFIHFYQD